MRNGLRIFGGLVSLAALLYGVALKVVLPHIAKSQITNAVQEGCASCKLEIGSVSFDLVSPGEVQIRDVRLKQGHVESSELLIRVDSFFVEVDLANSTFEKILIANLELRKPDVRLVDGDENSSKVNSEPVKSGPAFEVRQTVLVDGAFTYTRNTKGTTATLNLEKIDGELSAFGTTGDLKDKFVDAHFRAQIEKSGETEVDIRVPMRGGDRNVDVSLYLRGQELGTLNSFFIPNAGLELKGKIVKARGRARVREQDLTASAWVVYHGLDLKLNPTDDRSKTESFFLNVGADLVMKEDDLDLDKKDQTDYLHAKREPNERIVGFVLRGFKEVAIKVARKSPSQPRPAGLSSAD